MFSVTQKVLAETLTAHGFHSLKYSCYDVQYANDIFVSLLYNFFYRFIPQNSVYVRKEVCFLKEVKRQQFCCIEFKLVRLTNRQTDFKFFINMNLQSSGSKDLRRFLQTLEKRSCIRKSNSLLENKTATLKKPKLNMLETINAIKYYSGRFGHKARDGSSRRISELLFDLKSTSLMGYVKIF